MLSYVGLLSWETGTAGGPVLTLRGSPLFLPPYVLPKSFSLHFSCLWLILSPLPLRALLTAAFLLLS